MAEITLQQALELGRNLHKANRLADAEAIYRRILAAQPDHPPALHLLGILSYQIGRNEAAVDLFGRAIAFQPNVSEYHSDLSLSLFALGRVDDALAACGQAIRLRLDSAAAWNNRGMFLFAQGQYQHAVDAYTHALTLEPRAATIHSNLGNSLNQLGRRNDAIAAFNQAIALAPNYAQAFSNMADVYCELGRLDDALAANQQAVQIDPRHAVARYNLGNVLRDLRRYDEAFAEYSHAVALDANLLAAKINLAGILKDTGRIAEAMPIYRQVAQSSACAAEQHSALAMSIHFDPASDMQEILNENLRWTQRHAEPLKSQWQAHGNDRSPDRKLRIGYLSGDFRDHCQSFFTTPLLSHHDRGQFEIVCYSSVRKPDGVTARLRSHADEWHDVSASNDANLAELIRSDRIDILVDLAMHMAGNRLLVMARKPAPVQLTWLAYPGTAGVSVIDYRVSDPCLDPPGQFDHFYAEQTIRLPDSFWCYDPLTDAPAAGELPAIKNGFVTFGCLNNFCKVTPATLDLWAMVLKALPDSRLFLLAPEGSVRKNVLDRLGVNPGRIEFVPFRPRGEYLQTYQRIDIALDTLPYNGHTTSLDSFWMGVPVVTRIGSTIVGRAGWSQLFNLNLPELAAKTPDEFVRIAVELATDRSRLSELRAGLRERMRASPLMDAPRFAKAMETVYRTIWRRWAQRHNFPMPLAEFHPTIQRWFKDKFGEPTEPQLQGWPKIRAGNHTLISAPTGTGKTLAAYLIAIDCLLRKGPDLPDEMQILYVSPLRALSNDVQKNLNIPMQELRGLDPFLPEIRVLVRTGDTPHRERAAMLRKPPHILVTTPESLYLLLTSGKARDMLKTVRTVIIDEIHTLAKDKRGSHLALSLERLETLTGPFQRIGLSATQKPLKEIAHFLVGVDPDCTLVDVGHRRPMDIAIEVPPSALTTVCSHEQWDEIYKMVSELINTHRTTLIFVNTRKMAERITARLTDVMGEDLVTCHHSSLSRERRLNAEHRLKTGTLRALVATASLELGIDIGEVDLVIQLGATRSISTFLQRVGRSGHAVRRMPKGRLFPLTIDELVEAAALLRAVKRGELDRTLQPIAPLDILAQQIVAACVQAGESGWSEQVLFETFKRAWPYRNLTRDDFDSVIKLHVDGRRGLLHRDGIGGRVMARKSARLTALTGGGAIPDVADYRVIQDPQGLFVGTVNEDFAIESNVGDIFQLGNTSWRILKVERGVLRVADAQGQPPSIPFWLGEGPSRTAELSAEIGKVREEGIDPTVLQDEIGLSPEAATQIAEYIAEGRRVLGVIPTQKRLVLERFFDESGGMQMVLHAPFGGRINRAWGLALRKRFCRGFGFELQAAANEEALVISLGMQHSFPLADVFNYLHPDRVKDILTQAVLDQPMFESRWRWNATRSLVLAKFQGGKMIPPQIMRMRAGDLLAQAFPAAVACPENLPPGDLPVPMEHPLVRQTIGDCLTEATDLAGLIEVLRELRNGSIERFAIDTPEPSAFARGILNSGPYTFLDDAPLEERRTQAVLSRRSLDVRSLDSVGALDRAAVDRVREEVWPQAQSVEEVHDALLWMGFVTDAEAVEWGEWLNVLEQQNRVIHKDDRWYAADGMTEPKKILLGRLEALGPVFEEDPRIAMGDQTHDLLLELEHEGAIMRTRVESRPAWCERRLLARIHRYTIERLRHEIEPVSSAEFLQFLTSWQHVSEESRLDGPGGVAEVLRQLAGFEIPAWAWESHVLPRRVRDFKREWLEEVTLSGEFAWGRLWGGATTPIRVTPVTLVPRDDLDSWLTLAPPPADEGLTGPARDLLAPLMSGGAMFPQNLRKAAKLVPTHFEMGLADLVARGFITCDSFAALRQMITPPSKRRVPLRPVGRWSGFRETTRRDHTPEIDEMVARLLLRRTGVVFRRTVGREKIPVNWLSLTRVFRRMELRGEIRGGRFVAGFSGEQFALPQAVELLRHLRRQGPRSPVTVVSVDPLNFQGILTPEKRIAAVAGQEVLIG